MPRRGIQSHLWWSFVRTSAASCVAATLACCGCNHLAATGESADKPAASPGEAPQVSVAQVRVETWARGIRVQGSLLGDEQAVIGAKIPGRVQHVPVDLGTVVAKDQPLVVFDQRELELRVQQAEAQLRETCAAIGITPDQSELQLVREQAPPVLLELAQLDESLANFERGKRLQKGAITESEFARLEALHKMAQARYQSALNNIGQQIALVGVRRAELALSQQQLQEASIVAPFDAVVERRHVAPGEYVQIGQSVVTLVRTDVLRYTAGVPETKAGQVKTGQTIRIEVPGAAERIEAVVSRVSPAVTQSSRSLWVEADVANPGRRLQAGTFAEAEIIVDPDARSITVPASAVREFAGVQKVWIVRDGKAAEQPVRIGRREPTRVEIVDGLTTGELVVRNSHEGRFGDVVAVNETVVAKPEVAAEDSNGQEGLAE